MEMEIYVRQLRNVHHNVPMSPNFGCLSEGASDEEVDDEQEGSDGDGEVAHEFSIISIGLQQTIDSIPSPSQETECRLEPITHVIQESIVIPGLLFHVHGEVLEGIHLGCQSLGSLTILLLKQGLSVL